MIGSVGLGLGSVGTAAEPGGGGEAPGSDILSAIYTAGLADPAADNVFNGASGNLRFWLSATSGQFPNVGFFEDATTHGDTRVAAWWTQRYYNSAVGIGGIAGDAFVGYDPLWNGSSVGALNDFVCTSEAIKFSNAAAQDTVPTLGTVVDLGAAQWAVTSGFFNGPATYPTPGNNPGTRVVWRLSLWNSISNALYTAHELNGWGQHYQYPTPTAAGITAAMYSAVDWGNAPAANNNGIGWFIGRGLNDPPRAIFEAHMLDGALPGGAYGLGFWAAAGAGTISQIATMDWTKGIVFNAPITGLGNGTNVQLLLSADIDVQTAGVYQWTPSIPGYYISVNRTAFFCTQRTGVPTSGFTCSWGNNGTQDNFGTSAAVSINAVNATTIPSMGAGPAFNTNNQSLIDATTPISVKITSGVTGTTVCKGQFALWCALIPVGQLV